MSGWRSWLPDPSPSATATKSTVLVEPASPAVGLEAIQVQPLGASRPGQLEQPAADAMADPVGRHVELLDHGLRQRHERDDAAAGIGGDPGLVAGEHLVRQPRTDVRIGMGRREVEGGPPGGEPDVAQGRAVGRARSTDRDLGAASRAARPSPDHRPGNRPAAASSRIHVTPDRRASWAGQRRGSTSGPNTEPTASAFSAPATTMSTDARGPHDRGVERDPFDPRLDVGRRRDRERELARVDRGRPGEHRQQVPVRAHAEEQQVERRPAVDCRQLGRAQLIGKGGGTPGGAASVADRLACREWVDLVTGIGTPRPAPPAVPSSMSPMSSITSSNGFTFESGWSRGT